MDIRLGMTANDRPEYLHEVLKTWEVALRVPAVVEHDVFRYVYVEPGDRTAETAAWPLQFGWHVHLNDRKLGPLVNPYEVLKFGAQDQPDETLLVLGEDDSIVTPDAFDCLMTMYWMATLSMHDFELHRTLFCLNHRDPDPLVGGRDAARVITESDRFCPSVWAITAGCWRELIELTWDHDYSHKGWDWNLNDRVIPEFGLRVMAPSLSRSQHIGHDGGAHTTPENWQSGLAPTFDPESRETKFRFQRRVA